MRNFRSILGATSIVAAFLTGCAGDPYYSSQPQPYPSSQNYPSPQAQGAYYGVVDRIEVVQKGDSSNIAGTVIGGIVGGLIGHQIGSGRGNTAATIAGAAGGAYVGNQAEQRTRRGANETFRVTVRMDDGSWRTVTQGNITDLRTGDRVRVEGDSVHRV